MDIFDALLGLLRKEVLMFLKLPRNNFRGFTMVEILVVVAILGTLAAIVIPNVIHLRSEGQVESANTELYNSQLAILSAMTDPDNTIAELTSGAIGPNNLDVSVATGNTDTIPEIDVADYINGILNAIYAVDTKGHITDATIIGLTNSKWQGLNYVPGSGWVD
jgi:prepilin-type N-terminal cleavage/methylation domain-containing protein